MGAYACSDDQFDCGNGNGCIPLGDQCDYFLDCPNNADELDCDICNTPEHFDCDGSRCVPLSWQCDGEEDCTEGEDEFDCECDADEFECPVAEKCIPESWVCDGENDCDILS